MIYETRRRRSGRSASSARVGGLVCCLLIVLLGWTGACSKEGGPAGGSSRSRPAREPAPEPDVQTRFQEAALRGRIEGVRELLAAGAEIDVPNRGGTTPLISSAIGGHGEVTRLLLEAGADVAATNEAGRSALFFALDRPDKRGAADVANALLDHGARIPGGEGTDSFLIKLVRAQRWELAGRLLELGLPAPGPASRERLRKAVGDEDYELLIALLGSGRRGGPAASLCLAIYRADAELFGELLGQGLEDQRCKEDLPLIAAAVKGKVEVLEALLAHGANVNRVGKNGRTALMMAARFNQLEAARTLLARGADVNLQGFSKDGESSKAIEGSPLIEAVSFEHEEMVDLLLAAGADVNLVDQKGSTALGRATARNLNRMVRRLLAAGASYDRISSGSLQSLLTYNACNGDIVEYLLSGGADPHQPNEQGTPPLVAVAECPSGYGSVRRLVEAGADVNARDAEGTTPLIAAARVGTRETAEYLLEHGAELEAVDAEGRTALTVSVQSHDSFADRTEALLAHGAVVDHRDAEGATPLMRAAAGARARHVAALVDGGARLDLRDPAGHTAAVYFRSFGAFRPRERVLATDDGDLKVVDHWFHGCAAKKRIYSDRKVASCQRTEQYGSILLTIYRAPGDEDASTFLRSLHPEAQLFALPRPEGTGSWVAARMPGGPNRDAVLISTVVSVGDRQVQVEVESPEDRLTLREWVLAGFAESLERENG